MLLGPDATLYSSVSTVLSRGVFEGEGPTGEIKLMKMARELLFNHHKEKTHRYVHAVFKCLNTLYQTESLETTGCKVKRSS